MFSWCDDYLYDLTRTFPILNLIFHRHSFLRTYVFDNWFFVILTHVLFYMTVRFAISVIKKIEIFNEEKLNFLKENRERYTQVAALKNKKAEYEDTVIKVKESQVLTTLKLLNTQLGAVKDHLAETDKKLDQLIFTSCTRVLRATSLTEQPNRRQSSREVVRPRSRISRFWNRPSHRLCLPPENMGSLSVDLLDNVARLHQLHFQRLQMHPPKSDSSNYASVEASSESAIRRRATKFALNGGDRLHGKRRRKIRGNSYSSNMTRFDFHRLHSESLKSVSTFTKSLLRLYTIFPRNSKSTTYC
ncbi:uncharacterized protein LOC143207596 [Lasioglossum baleicum]|uniref:uncharacterized protein LOC143207596 n=1 Tax=Lasioglossum baleicum TaxID=434251 RepID=UPI003FCD2DDC